MCGSWRHKGAGPRAMIMDRNTVRTFGQYVVDGKQEPGVRLIKAS